MHDLTLRMPVPRSAAYQTALKEASEWIAAAQSAAATAAPELPQDVHEETEEEMALVDSRIRVWWTEEKAWYAGRVVSIERGAGGNLNTTVAYDDGSTETHDLGVEAWEAWEAKPAPKRKPSSSGPFEPTEEEVQEGEEKEEEGYFCETHRHLPSNDFSFEGVWIQCDDCSRWCHGECTGFDKRTAEAVETYSCPGCGEAEEPDPAPIPAAVTPAVAVNQDAERCPTGAAHHSPHVSAVAKADDNVVAAPTTASSLEVVPYPTMSVAEMTAYNDVLELGDGIQTALVEFWAAL